MYVWGVEGSALAREVNRSRLGRSAAILLALGLSAVVGVAGVEFFLRSLGYSSTKLTLAIVPSVIGFAIWVWSGAAILEAASWSVPLAIVSVLCAVLLPYPLDFVSQLLVLGLVILMIFTKRLPAWWFQHVLRRQVDSDTEHEV
jgi:hypothetical protein